MEEMFVTLQDFMTFTKGVTYILILFSLLVIVGFWNFLTGNDDEGA